MFKHVRGDHGGTDAQLAVNMRVRVYPGTNAASRGVVVEDFGEMQPQAVALGSQHFADPARRCAVQLDTGDLVYADTDQLIAE